MMREDVNAVEILREKNYHFRTLERSHHQLEASLDGLCRKRILTPSEEVQKKTYQKEKLAVKDSMTEIMRHFQNTGEADFKIG